MGECGDRVDCHDCCGAGGWTPSTPVHIPDRRHIRLAQFLGGVGHPAERRPARKSTSMMVRNLMIFGESDLIRGPNFVGQDKGVNQTGQNLMPSGDLW